MREFKKDGFCIRQLSIEEMLSVYQEYMVHDFPDNELKPAEAISFMFDKGAYEGLGLFKEDAVVSYAFFAKLPKAPLPKAEKSKAEVPKAGQPQADMSGSDTEVLLLDYFAVVERFRNSGMGSFFLQAMQEYYCDRAAILIETEQPEKAKSPEERQMRERRNAFYERNGCRQTGVWCGLFSVDYGIFALPLAEQFSDKQVFEKLDAIYRYMFQGGYYEKYVKIGCDL